MLVHNLFRLCMIVRRKTPTNFFYLYVPCTSDRSRLIQIGWLTYNNVQKFKPVSPPKNRFSTVSYVFARSPGLGRCRSKFGFDPGFSVIAVSALMNPEQSGSPVKSDWNFSPSDGSRVALDHGPGDPQRTTKLVMRFRIGKRSTLL